MLEFQHFMGKHLVVVGAGGNIGSHLIGHLSRMPEVSTLTLIDPDSYEERNLRGQDITRRDIGRHKVTVQARRIRQINPAIMVTALPMTVQQAPLGCLRGDLILACLDTRLARQYVNQAAWRLGIPWIDAGVRSDGLLTRVNVYHPAADVPCLECAWSELDYSALEVAYPCQAETVQATDAPSMLGAAVAAMQAIEAGKLLRGEQSQALCSEQVVLDLQHHRHFRTRMMPNPHCRFDHRQMASIHEARLARDATLAGVLALAAEQGMRQPEWLRLDGKTLLTQVVCHACGRVLQHLRIIERMRRDTFTCRCGQRGVRAGGFGMYDRLALAANSATLAQTTLRSLGCLAGDIMTVGNPSEEVHLQLSPVAMPANEQIEELCNE